LFIWSEKRNWKTNCFEKKNKIKIIIIIFYFLFNFILNTRATDSYTSLINNLQRENTKLIISGNEKDIKKCFCNLPNGQITSYFNEIEELEFTNIQILNTFCLNKFIN
jgi:hypothetical protein